MKSIKVIILVGVVLLIFGSVVYLESKKPDSLLSNKSNPVELTVDSMTKSEKAKKYQVAQEITNPSDYVNTDQITIQELIGKKVILVDFWTYSCINCQRTLPYLTSWYEKYRDQGLEIIGVHTPEFEFEKDINNVRKAAAQYNIEYPVVLDNDYGTWSAYRNRYWPRKYLIDIDGYVVYDHIGEGGYEETEKIIQQLLEERKNRLGENLNVSKDIVEPAGVETVDFTKPRSPEIYFGAARNTNLVGGYAGQTGEITFKDTTNPRTDVLYLVGKWNLGSEHATNLEAGAKIIFKYQAQKVFMVASADQEVKLTILRDGQPVGQAAGTDVIDDQVTVKGDQLYRLIEDPQGWGEHTLEIIIESPGLKAFTFTFG